MNDSILSGKFEGATHKFKNRQADSSIPTDNAIIREGEQTITRDQLLSQIQDLLRMEEQELSTLRELAKAKEFAEMTEDGLVKLLFKHYSIEIDFNSKELFAKVDVNKDGKIDRRELKEFLLKAGLRPSFFRFKEYARHMDIDGKPNDMNLEEFTAFMNDICLCTSEATAESDEATFGVDYLNYANSAFEALVKENGDTISYEDLNQHLQAEGYSIKVKDVVLNICKGSTKVSRTRLQEAFGQAYREGFNRGRRMTMDPNALFDKIDENRDGKISVKEMHHHFKKFGLKATKIEKMDKNKELDRKGFVAIMKDMLGGIAQYSAEKDD